MQPSSIETETSFVQDASRLIEELFPICRSITGDGVRRTLQILKARMPLTVHEVPTGTRVFDWVVPKEWNIAGAFIKDATGRKVVDFADNNLHVVGYSTPVHVKLPLQRLKERLFTVPGRPDWIPYRTSYYREDWGFCLSERQLSRMADGEYEVFIDSTLSDGNLTYGELHLPGATPDEVLLSCHICHPSLCNDNLSGIALMNGLFDHLSRKRRRYSYRFLFVPGTIGSITWLALNEGRVPLVRHGIVVAGVGDKGPFSYKKSRRGNAEVDRAFSYVLEKSCERYNVIDFHPYGYDERQFCSPGFDLPVGCVMRTPFGQYPEYHTSADNRDFISLDALSDSLDTCIAALDILESNRTYLSQNPKCEPQLGKRGLYQAIGGHTEKRSKEMAILWTLNLADGAHSLLDIAERSHHDFGSIRDAASLLAKHDLLKEATEASRKPPPGN